MYYHLITQGEYDDYTVVALVKSEKPIIQKQLQECWQRAEIELQKNRKEYRQAFYEEAIRLFPECVLSDEEYMQGGVEWYNFYCLAYNKVIPILSQKGIDSLTKEEIFTAELAKSGIERVDLKKIIWRT